MKAHEEGTDEQLIERWNRQRDPAALNLLMSRYLPRFYLTARSMLMPVEEAEDIAQDVMLKVVVALDQFDARSTFQAWSYTILLNTVRTSMRQRKLRGQPVESRAARAISEKMPPPKEPVFDAHVPETQENTTGNTPSDSEKIFLDKLKPVATIAPSCKFGSPFGDQTGTHHSIAVEEVRHGPVVSFRSRPLDLLA